MRLTQASIGHEERDDLPMRLPKERHILQAYPSAIQARVPTGIIEAGHMPATLEPIVEQEYLAQKLPHAPEIVFSLVGATD